MPDSKPVIIAPVNGDMIAMNNKDKLDIGPSPGTNVPPFRALRVSGSASGVDTVELRTDDPHIPYTTTRVTDGNWTASLPVTAPGVLTITARTIPVAGAVTGSGIVYLNTIDPLGPYLEPVSPAPHGIWSLEAPVREPGVLTLMALSLLRKSSGICQHGGRSERP